MIVAKPGTPLDPDALRKMVRRSRAIGRRWILRGVLFVVVAVVALQRGGTLMVVLSVACWLLAVLSLSLGRQMRLQAAAIEQKIELMHGTAGGPGAPGAQP